MPERISGRLACDKLHLPAENRGADAAACPPAPRETSEQLSLPEARPTCSSLNLHRVWAACDVPNDASYHVMESWVRDRRHYSTKMSCKRANGETPICMPPRRTNGIRLQVSKSAKTPSRNSRACRAVMVLSRKIELHFAVADARAQFVYSGLTAKAYFPRQHCSEYE